MGIVGKRTAENQLPGTIELAEVPSMLSDDIPRDVTALDRDQVHGVIR
jgi:hypothetical protein